MAEVWEVSAAQNKPTYEEALKQAEADLVALESQRRALLVTIAGLRSLLSLDSEAASPASEGT